MRLFLDAIAIYLRAWLGAFTRQGRRLAPLTPTRIAVLLAFPVFLALQCLHWFFLALDHLLFPGFRRQAIERPVFIIGVPRSGTTFLHRTLAEDQSFTTPRTWELLFAPSLCQRYLMRSLGRIDGLVGSPLSRLLRWVVRRGGRRLEDVHPVGLEAAEEDYLALLPAAGCFFASLAFPASRELNALGDLTSLPAARRRWLLTHYRGLMQRQVYAHAGRQLLSKNAAFASWGEALAEVFPDAEIIVCIREPLEAVSSQVSSLQSARRLFAIDPTGLELPRRFESHYRCWYRHLDRFARQHQPLVIEQAWMAAHGDAVLRQIHARLGRQQGAANPAAVAGKPGDHRHRPADFGLHPRMLDRALSSAYRALSRQAVLQR